jgi:hypothetical protein
MRFVPRCCMRPDHPPAAPAVGVVTMTVPPLFPAAMRFDF